MRNLPKKRRSSSIATTPPPEEWSTILSRCANYAYLGACVSSLLTTLILGSPWAWILLYAAMTGHAASEVAYSLRLKKELDEARRSSIEQ